jgi:hypothetical protein
MPIPISLCLHCFLSSDSAEVDYCDGLKQGFYVLILECFVPDINVSINTEVAFNTDVSHDKMNLCMMP